MLQACRKANKQSRLTCLAATAHFDCIQLWTMLDIVLGLDMLVATTIPQLFGHPLLPALQLTRCFSMSPGVCAAGVHVNTQAFNRECHAQSPHLMLRWRPNIQYVLNVGTHELTCTTMCLQAKRLRQQLGSLLESECVGEVQLQFLSKW